MKTLLDQIQVSITANNPKDSNVDVWVVPMFKDEKLSSELKELDGVLDGEISNWIKQDFVVNDIEKHTWVSRKTNKFKTTHFLFMSLGKKADFTRNSARDAFGTVARVCNNRGFHRVGLFNFNTKEVPFELSLEGFLLGAYRFFQYKTEKKTQTHIRYVEISCINSASAKALQKHYERIEPIVRSTYFARDLVNEPANTINPETFANIAQKIATEAKLSIKILKTPELKKEDMNLILAVGMGSSVEPRLIHMEYKPKKKAKHTIALVGKGVTFDTGGYSLKPPVPMLGMKMDMAGAASVLATMWCIATLKLDVHVHAFMPMVENMVNGHSVRPGDVIRARNGKTVEIDNTDAEGRLILADALNYAEEFNPDYMIDVATLTGACVIALGDEIAGMYSTDDKLKEMLEVASKNVGEKMWNMPL
jgi:leucyl aminopeptidase